MTTYTVTPDATASTTKPVSGKSPARSRADQNFGGTSTTFKSLSPQQKSGWQSAANALNIAQGRTGRRKISAANAFKMYASGRLAIGLPIQLDAPVGADLNLPPQLPRTIVNATHSQSTGKVKVTLTPDFAVSNPVQILCSAPQIAGKNTWPNGSFSPVGYLNAMSAGPNDISGMVSAKYGAVQVGEELALRLVATSPAGLRRGYLCVLGFCAGITAEGVGTDDSNGTSDADLHVA